MPVLLWGMSAFPTENSNGALVKLVSAAEGVAVQIVERCTSEVVAIDSQKACKFA